MAYEVAVEHADPRPIGAIRSTVTRQQLGSEVIRLLDIVWPALRGQGVRTGHNVVVYRGTDRGQLVIDVGVEAFAEFVPYGSVQRRATPSGEVATTAHHREYSEMGAAYAALERWCKDVGRRPTGVRWEVYGDSEDDPVLRGTEVSFLLDAAPPGEEHAASS